MTRPTKFALGLLILGAGAAAAVSLHSRRMPDCRETRVGGDLSGIVVQLREFHRVSGRLPTDGEGLCALVERPTDVENWIQLSSELSADPWGRPYQYRLSPQRAEGFDVFTLGPDPASDSDDIHFPRR